MTDDIMRKIRGLLAKAEGTDSDHEAETFFSAAQKLMAKYQIDQAQLAASGKKQYASATHKVIQFPRCVGRDWKVNLLHQIALLFEGKVVNLPPRNKTRYQQGRPGAIMLFAIPEDIPFIEMLWTSLCITLDSSTARYLHQEAGNGVHGRTLRVSFIYGWVERMTERLKEAYGETIQEQDASDSLAMVWVGKRDAVEQHIEETIKTRQKRLSINVDPFAATAGGQAANSVDIRQGNKVRAGTPRRADVIEPYCTETQLDAIKETKKILVSTQVGSYLHQVYDEIDRRATEQWGSQLRAIRGLRLNFDADYLDLDPEEGDSLTLVEDTYADGNEYVGVPYLALTDPEGFIEQLVRSLVDNAKRTEIADKRQADEHIARNLQRDLKLYRELQKKLTEQGAI